MTEPEVRHEARGFHSSWQKGMTDAEVRAVEEAWERQYRSEKEARKQAFRERGFMPPRQSQVNGPPADWKRWNALLDGIPVGSCWAYDVDAGWVEVWVIVRKTDSGPVVRSRTGPRRRLYGKVTPVSNEEHTRLKAERGLVEVWAHEPRGEIMPGTEIREP